MSNLKYAFSIRGIAKSVTLVFGLISVSIMSHAYDKSLYNNYIKISDFATINSNVTSVIAKSAPGIGKEEYFFAVIVLWFLLSLGFFLCHLVTEELEKSYGAQFMDAGFHALGSLLIFIGACLVFSSAININKLGPWKDTAGKSIRVQYKSEKIAAGVFSLFNSVVYGVTAWLTFVGTPVAAE